MQASRIIKVTLSLFLIYWSSLASGQVSQSGMVVDLNEQPITGANVVVRTKPEGKMLSFAITDRSGRYTLGWASTQDSIFVQITHLNFATDQAWVKIGTTTKWMLTSQAYDLPEMVVKQEAVTRRGDTIVYDASQLEKAGDNNIEDLLRHIPGITVNKQGQISYNDLKISKFYIEGLDLLEGRYNIATRNLRTSAVRDVEIIEHHQHVLALDSLVRPPNAAINIRLKSTVSLTGVVSGAAGLLPPAHEIEGSLFSFSKKQQFSLLGSANNIGKAFADNFQDHYRKTTFQLPLVSPANPISPLTLNAANYLNNDLLTGGFNWLNKAGKYSQLKLDGYFSSDEVAATGNNRVSFLSQSNPFTYEQMISNTANQRVVNGRVTYEYNHPKVYFKSAITGNLTNSNQLAQNTINASPLTENFKNNEVDLAAKFTSIIRTGKKALRINGQYDLDEENIDLVVSPLSLTTFTLQPIYIRQAAQQVSIRTQVADIYSNHYAKRKNATHSMRFGVKANRSNLRSNIKDISSSPSAPLGTAFSNDNLTTTSQAYADYRFEKLIKGNKWKLTLPISSHFFRHQDAISENDLERNLVVATPRVEYIKRLASQRSLSFAYQYDLNYQNDQLFYAGYLLREGRQLFQNTPILNRTRQHKASTRFKGRNGKGTIDFGSFLEGKVTNSDFLQTTIFNQQGEASRLNADKNRRTRLSSSNKIRFYGLKSIDLDVKADYHLDFIPINVNGQRLNVDVHQLTISTNVSYAIKNTSLNVSPKLHRYGNELSEAPVLNLDFQLGLYHKFPHNWGNIKGTYNNYRTSIGSTIISNNLVNLRYQRPLWGDRYVLSITINNLTNEDFFTSFQRSAFTEQLSHFRLRQRQFIVGIRRDL